MNSTANDPAFECPVILHLNDAHTQAKSYARAMRRLRKSMLGCPKCEQYESCPVMQQFRIAIRIALEEISQEWDLRV